MTELGIVERSAENSSNQIIFGQMQKTWKISDALKRFSPGL